MKTNDTSTPQTQSDTLVFIDYENVQITLERRGVRPAPRCLIAAIQTMTAGLGQFIGFEAYADWTELERHNQMDIQRQLTELGIHTHSVISQHGKNSADMRIVNDIRDVIEPVTGRADLKRIVLVSGDRDFQDLIWSVRKHGREALVLGLRGSMSASLANAAQEVRYLDKFFADQPHKPLVPEGRKTSTEGTGQKLSFLKEKCKNETFLQAVCLKSEVSLAAALEYLAKWVPERIAETFHKGLPWVDSNYLARGMAMDAQLQIWGLGQDRREAEAWLEAVEALGLIVRKMQAHPKTPDHQITTWILPADVKTVSAAPRKAWPLHTRQRSARSMGTAQISR